MNLLSSGITRKGDLMRKGEKPDKEGDLKYGS